MDLQSFLAIAEAWPTEWVILGALIILSTIDSFRYGSNRSTAVSLALPLTALFWSWLPTSFLLGSFSQQFSTPPLDALQFAVLFAVIFFLTYKVISPYNAAAHGPLLALLMGITTGIVLIVVWTQIPALQSFRPLNDMTRLIFGEAYRLWWLLGAYLAMAFIRS